MVLKRKIALFFAALALMLGGLGVYIISVVRDRNLEENERLNKDSYEHAATQA